MRARIIAALRPAAAGSRGPALCSDYDLNTPPPQARALKPAAVLIPIVERSAELTVLLTKRTDHLHDHPGQISFPGGRSEAGDPTPAATALRETAEEIGLEHHLIEVAGYLDPYETVTGYLVTPVVAFVQPQFELAVDHFEVADVFEVPLTFLLDLNNRRTHRFLRDGVERFYYAFEYEQRYIWGATAGMLSNFIARLAAGGRDSPSRQIP